MEAWLQWAVNIIAVTIIGIVAFFIKRTLAQIDEHQKTANETLIKQMEQLKREWSARLDKTDADIEKVETRLNEIVRDMPRMYVQKEDWLLSNQNIDRKLDKIMEILIGLGGAQGDRQR